MKKFQKGAWHVLPMRKRILSSPLVPIRLVIPAGLTPYYPWRLKRGGTYSIRDYFISRY